LFYKKRQELDILLKTFINKPQIIAITEVKNKRNGDINTAELNIQGYNLYTNDLTNNCRGVLIYVDIELNSKLLNHNQTFQEIVLVSVKGNDEQLIFGNIYRSPNSTQENDLKLSEFINHVSKISDGETNFSRRL
jgi:hypothetical protein